MPTFLPRYLKLYGPIRPAPVHQRLGADKGRVDSPTGIQERYVSHVFFVPFIRSTSRRETGTGNGTQLVPSSSLKPFWASIMVASLRLLSSALPDIVSPRVNIMGRPHDFFHQILCIKIRTGTSLANALHHQPLGTLFAQHCQAPLCRTWCGCWDVDGGWDDADAGGQHGLCEC